MSSMKRWMLVAEPMLLAHPESLHAAQCWNLAHAYAETNRYWRKRTAVRAGAAWTLDPQVGPLVRFRVMRVIAW